MLNAIFGAWLVITACFCVIMVIDVVLGWRARPRADKPAVLKPGIIEKIYHDVVGHPKATIHYPITDEQEAREEIKKENDKKGVATPIEDAI